MTDNDLRKRIGAVLDLSDADPVWTALLEQAEAALATIHQLEALVASDGLLSSGSKEQVRIHPAVVELRQQRAAYAKLLVQLGLDEHESTSQRQSRYARKRWSK